MSGLNLKKVVGSLAILVIVMTFFFIASFLAKHDTETEGPHLFISNEGTKELIYSITGRKIEETYRSISPDQKYIEVNAPKENKTFRVEIKDTYDIVDDTYPKQDKILITSDIEGDFSFLKNKLIQNAVIDKDYNWIYGKGHLVIIGDVFDRGKYVTECLWLIYKLEQEAQDNGGGVHLILGNHEIMALQGDHRYVSRKYKRLAKQSGLEYSDYFSNNTVLGKWLRKKNVVEQIGNKIFVHGGISTELAQLNLTISQINQIARKHIDELEYSDNEISQLIMGTKGPMWYRGYIENPISPKELSMVRQQYGASHFIIGHTLVNNISSLIESQVYAVDIDHSDPSALLIQDDKFFVVQGKNSKTELE